jgi:hypothetical protein
VKYIIVAKWLKQHEMENLCIKFEKDNWHVFLTNCTVVFEKINDDLTLIELVK